MNAVHHPVAWAAPQPWWRAGPATTDARAALAQPQILRFASDEFVEEMLATLERAPGTLADYTAQPETWREPMDGPRADPSAWVDRKPARLLPLLRKVKAKGGLPAIPQPKPLKLYQPAHQRHYLVAASLICQAPGLPDRAIDPARQRVSFVVRRLFPKVMPADGAPLPQPTNLADWEEHAWVLVGKSGEWQSVGNAGEESAVAKVHAGEERLAMFPAKYAEANGHPRRLFVGSVPVGRRETYQAGEKRSTPRTDTEAATLAYEAQFQADVLGPWRALVNLARELDGFAPFKIYNEKAFVEKEDGTFSFSGVRNPLVTGYALQIDEQALRNQRSQLQLSSWYLLLDLRKYLERYLPDYLVWLDDSGAGAMPAGLADFDAALRRVAMPTDMATGALDILKDTGFVSSDLAAHLPDAIKRIGPFEDKLENALSGQADYASKPFDLSVKDAATLAQWPDFLFLFVDPVYDVPPPTTAETSPTADFVSEKLQAKIDALVSVLPTSLLTSDKPPPEPTLASLRPTDMREAWYVMRMLYERPDCEPFEREVVSRATVPFQMAGFFDPDAPARPIRIGLPIDISPAGLRKFDKNAVLMMSDMLCGHIDRFKGMTLGDLVLSVLPWPFHKGLSVPDKGPCAGGGVMCSLSIPIITICALILLMIIVSLLDLIFRWLPLFVVCFPLPGFKGKKKGS